MLKKIMMHMFNENKFGDWTVLQATRCCRDWTVLEIFTKTI